jgi:hypothetical protein
MLNLTTFLVFEPRDGSSGVTLILYTALSRRSAGALTGETRSFDPEIVTPFQRVNGWGGERSKTRGFITDKRRKGSMFVERLVKLEQESYERHASVGARGEPIGN